MTTAIKLPLRSLNADIMRDLQEKYPEAEISVNLHQNRNHAPLSEQDFWKIIGLLDWTKEGDDTAILKPAVTYLMASPVRHIFDFADMLSEKLFATDGRVFAQNIGEDSWTKDSFFSVDNFLYARACVVANGKSFFKQVLKDPTKMPKDLTFEALIYLPSDAFEQKTGKNYTYSPAFPIETGSNAKNWEN
jgi:hypothetical protein